MSFRTVQISPTEARLRDAEYAYDLALRHGTAGDVSRARRYLNEARIAARGDRS